MTGRLFGELKSDLGAVFCGLGLALQQPVALKGSQMPQRFAVFVLVGVSGAPVSGIGAVRPEAPDMAMPATGIAK